jgi:mono/diheme cytochrome c family protein
MKRSGQERVKWAALFAAVALAGCGGGGNGGSQTNGSTGVAAPAPGPSPSPSPAPAPAPGPAPAPAPAPAPSPGAPSPSPQITRGATLYQANCSGCHGDDPEIGTQGIYKGLTPEILTAAYRRVDVMGVFAVLLSSADTTDLAAFIKSRVSP